MDFQFANSVPCGTRDFHEPRGRRGPAAVADMDFGCLCRFWPQWRLWPQSRLHLAAVAVSLWGFAAVSLWEKNNVRNAEAAAEAAAEAVAEAAAAAAAAAAVDAIRIEP